MVGTNGRPIPPDVTGPVMGATCCVGTTLAGTTVGVTGIVRPGAVLRPEPSCSTGAAEGTGTWTPGTARAIEYPLPDRTVTGAGAVAAATDRAGERVDRVAETWPEPRPDAEAEAPDAPADRWAPG